MTHRTRAIGKGFVLGAAALVMASAVPLTAQAVPSFAIKECAQASTLRATIDPKKKDAAQKTREVNRLMDICRQKVAAQRAQGPAPSPIKKSFVRSSVQRPPNNPPPRPVQPPVRPAQPPMRPATPPPPQAGGANRTISLGDLFNSLRRRRQPPAAPPAAPPQPAMAPRPAAPAPAPAAPPVVPVAYTPPVPPPPQPATADQRSVFGIQLGEAFTLPACAPGVVNAKDSKAFESTSKVKARSVTASCAQKGPAVQTLAQRMADAEGKPIPSGVEFALVRLSADRCPAWVSGGCTLSVALKSGVALGVSFLTVEDAERDIVRQLAGKYNGRPLREAVACDVPASPGVEARRRMGNDTSWKLADLNVAYWPVNGLNCGQGRVMVKTTNLDELFDQAMSGDDQPKM